MFLNTIVFEMNRLQCGLLHCAAQSEGEVIKQKCS